MVLLPAPVGTALMALFGLDLAWTIWGMQATVQAETLGAFFAGPNTIRVAIDLAGMAIAGAFLVVPTFAAVQAWAPEDRRARVVAAVSIVNAGFMTVGGVAVAAIQAAGSRIAQILLGLAVLNAVAAWLMLKYPADQRVPRFRLDPVPRLPASRGRGPGQPQGGRPGADPGAQPCQLPRRSAGADADRRGAGLRHRLHHRAGLVDEAVPEAHPRPAAQPGQADVDAHADQDRAGRRSAGHLPGGPHHRHRRPDEGL